MYTELSLHFTDLCGYMNKMSVFSQWERWGWRDIVEASACFLWRSMCSRAYIHCALPIASVVAETAQSLLLIGSWSV